MPLGRYPLLGNLQKLIEKEIDLTLDDERVLRYQINWFMPTSMAKVEIFEKPLAIRGVNIGVSRFNKAIATMKQDGTYARILQKHK